MLSEPEAQMQSDAAAAADAFILGLYHELLGRQPGEAELAEWTAEIQRGLPLAQARQAFLDSAEYRARHAERLAREAVERTGLFDAAWYLRHYPDVAGAGWDALDHYCRHGRAEDRSPNFYLAPAWYRGHAALPPDTDALLHYAMTGEAQDLPPGPDFDPGWYRGVHDLDATASPLLHFLQHRDQHRGAPCPRLWSVLGMPAGAADPFEQFLSAQPPSDWPPSADEALLATFGLFDANYYALHSTDVLEADIDPLTHFCRFGWREGRNPSFYFSTRWYLQTNPDAARLAVNPLLHYLLVGEAGGRRPTVYFDPTWYRDHYAIPLGQSPLAHYLAHRRTQQYSPNALFDPAWYIAQSGTSLHGNRDPFTHFLIAGMQRDIPPSEAFDMAAWRRRTRGRSTRHFRHLLSPDRDNPLVHYLLSTYH